ncbi:flavin reductase [Microbacterium sp. NPDC091313]
MTESYEAIDPLRFREVMGNYPTGVTAVTGIADDGTPVGMVVGTFTSVSLHPPLVAFLPTTKSATFSRLRTATAFCINVLAHDQIELCRVLSSSDPEKFSRVEWTPTAQGAPALAGAVAQIHCRPSQLVEAGDHFIQLCLVDALEVRRQVTPLLFFQGGYGGFSPNSMLAGGGDSDLIEGVRLAAIAGPRIERLAASYRCEAAVLVAVSEDEFTTAATAYGGDAQMRERLGERLPLKPPMGEPYVAWSPQRTVDSWLSRAGRDPEVIAQYSRRLAALRERGFAALEMPADAARLAELISESRSAGLTPARERAVLTELAELTHAYYTGEFDGDSRYDIGSLLVPVYRPNGELAMVLSLAQLPQGVTGTVVESWIEGLRDAAAVVERQLGAVVGTPGE